MPLFMLLLPAEKCADVHQSTDLVFKKPLTLTHTPTHRVEENRHVCFSGFYDSNGGSPVCSVFLGWQRGSQAEHSDHSRLLVKPLNSTVMLELGVMAPNWIATLLFKRKAQKELLGGDQIGFVTF